MHRLIMGLALLAAACTAPVSPSPSNRNTTVPITSVALFDPARFAGHWEMIASIGPANCAIDVVAATSKMFDLSEHGCTGGVTHSIAQVTGPGRFTPTGGTNKGVEHWVMWVDQTYRTVVIGTVSGEFGMILNRDRGIPADRLKAAREILAWNGYDSSRLQMRP